MKNEHLDSEEIKSYIQFELSETENERIIAHLSDCELCLSQVDAIWASSAEPENQLQQARIEKELMNRISRSNLAGSLIVLSVKGLSGAILGLLNPIFKTNRKTR